MVSSIVETVSLWLIGMGLPQIANKKEYAMKSIYALFDNSGQAPRYCGAVRAASRLDAIHYASHYAGALRPVAVLASAVMDMETNKEGKANV